MHEALIELGAILIALFAGGVVAKKLKQSVIPAYILVGLAIQYFVHEAHFLHVLSDIGLILLLFFIGMEFSVSSFFINWRRTLSSGLIDLGINFPVGVAFGLMAGMGMLASLYLGAVVYISSTAIITKTMVDNRLSAHPESEVILRVLVFEDLLIAVLLVMFNSFGAGEAAIADMLYSLLKVAAFFVALTVVFKKTLPLINRALSVESPEHFIMLGLGFVMIIGGVASLLGVSEAVGAFVAGMLFSETEHKERIEEKMSPFKDLCAAIFFLYFGMTISGSGITRVILPAAALTLFGLVSKLLGGAAIGFAEKLSDRASIGVGVGLMARGEFSIILASLVPAGAALSGGYGLPALAALYVLMSGIIGAVAMKEYPRAYFGLMKRRTAGQNKSAA